MSVVVSQFAASPWTWISLPHTLDRDSALDSCIRQVRGKLLLLDASNVQRADTGGMLAWIRLLEQVQSLDIQPVLVGATGHVVAQLNLSQAFSTQTAVFSVLAPYFCPACSLEQRQELMITKTPSPMVVRELPCVSCNEPAHFDDVETVFFRFLPHIQPIDAALVTKALQELRLAKDETKETKTLDRRALGQTSLVNQSTESSLEAIQIQARIPPGWVDLLFYLLIGAVLAGMALVAMNWGGP
jgi:ABC-type transporter Mla MlaB component